MMTASRSVHGSPPAEISQLTTRVAYENRWLRLREDTVRRADGSHGLYGVVERRPFAIVVPWQDGRLTLVEQYRYPIGRRLWELPMGTCEPGADPLQTARTELAEETGLQAERIEPVGQVFQAPGYSDQCGHVFLVTGLREGPHAREASEQDMVQRAFPLAEVEAMIGAGALQDAMTLAALGLLRFKRLL